MKPYFPIFIVAVVLALFPVVTDSNVLLTLLIYSLIIGLAAQGWNVLAGIAGQNSFGHAAFFGTGAYVISLWQTNLHMNPWVGFLIALLVGAALGSIIGYLAFRAGLRGSYFALVTLAIAEVLRVLANAASFTGGAAGPCCRSIPVWSISSFQTGVFLLDYAALVVLSLVGQAIQRSRFGAQLVAVRENEGAAQALASMCWRQAQGHCHFGAMTRRRLPVCTMFPVYRCSLVLWQQDVGGNASGGHCRRYRHGIRAAGGACASCAERNVKVLPVYSGH